MKFGAPAEFMREYFRNARGIHNEVWRALDLHEGRESSLLNNFRDCRSPLFQRRLYGMTLNAGIKD